MTYWFVLHHDALTLHPPGHPHRRTTLNNLAFALKTRYDKLHLTSLGDPKRHVNLFNLSSALCSHFMHTQKNDIEEVINLCPESLAVLSSLHSGRELQTRIKTSYSKFSLVYRQVY
ncbi:uncharacterized protein BJ212DRAFT_1391063 [Suillus subaureus]|uniref:Uncharacterized protein n=1 Tax=Suillus subaureus TaxID=48587 RepID=A0A9P7DXT7_9AGAM|nr:uncharacterized protein BJ212DRAFT_1391063 [Suillus subaureus]KAG1805699.1 hypothetical protein BJ212DRAFT_1391063 [Suillus subaureus]